MIDISTILWLILIVELVLVVLWLVTREVGTPLTYRLQRDADLRLTYKRYIEIYPSANVTYDEYKRMQAQRAYRRAISSTKIKRMVR